MAMYTTQHMFETTRDNGMLQQADVLQRFVCNHVVCGVGQHVDMAVSMGMSDIMSIPALTPVRQSPIEEPMTGSLENQLVLDAYSPAAGCALVYACCRA